MKYYYIEFQRAIISKGYKVKNAVKFPLQNGLERLIRSMFRIFCKYYLTQTQQT